MLYHKMYFLVKFLDLIVSFTSEWLFFKSKYSKTKKKKFNKGWKYTAILILLSPKQQQPPRKNPTPQIIWICKALAIHVY